MANPEQKKDFYEKVDKKVAQFFGKEVEKVSASLASRGYINENAAPLFGEDSFDNQFNYMDAAKLYYMKTAKLPKADEQDALAEECDYDFEQWSEKFTDISNKECSKLAKDPYFQSFVRDYFLEKDPYVNGKKVDTDDFVNDYKAFVRDNEKAVSDWGTDIVPASDEMSTKSTIKVVIRSNLSMMDHYINDIVNPKSRITGAVDYIICKTLLSDAADKSFFNGVTTTVENIYNRKTGNNDIEMVKYSDNQLNERVKKMRDEIINDPLFKEVVATGKYKVKEVRDAYMKAVNLDINRKIKADKAYTKSLKHDTVKNNAYIDYVNGIDNLIDKDELSSIKKIYSDLKKYNEGKNPSDQMKKLMDVLDEVCESNSMNAAAVHKLNEAALDYYNDRQGIFFYPFTDNGKGRLASAEKLIKITEPKISKMNKEFEAANKKAEAKNNDKAPVI